MMNGRLPQCVSPTAILGSLALISTVYGQAIDPIEAIRGAFPAKPSVYLATKGRSPIVVRSARELAKHISEEQLAKFQDKLDWQKQQVLIFAWRGSGQDRLEFDVLESFPEQIVFRYLPGRTRDLRPHLHLFVLRSNVKWRLNDPTARKPKPVKDQYVKLEVRGKLNSQVLAIGGETTGVTIAANGVTLELEFAERMELWQLAKKWHDKTVVVTGQLHVKRGVEIRQRWIVDVEALRLAR
ncbi:MAG TPA: hypothetical protein EYG57_15940 [Planctomycetes bacterium]|nr:hypothetical protein [Planctomycetota bacterium]